MLLVGFGMEGRLGSESVDENMGRGVSCGWKLLRGKLSALKRWALVLGSWWIDVVVVNAVHCAPHVPSSDLRRQCELALPR